MVALLVTVQQHLLNRTLTQPILRPPPTGPSLTFLCPWDYPPVYIGIIYRRSPVVRFVGGELHIMYVVFFLFQFPISSLWGF